MSLWRRIFRMDARKSDLDDEMETHRRMAMADRVARGEPEDAARAAVEHEMGNLALARDVTREAWGWVWLEWLLQDVRYALRQMKRSRGFAATVIGTLALGIGAATAMFTVVDHVLLRQLPYKDAEQLVVMSEHGNDPRFNNGASWLDLAQWRAASHSFEDLAFWNGMEGRSYVTGGTGSALQINGLQVSPNLFALLGAKPALGPGFIAEPPGFGAVKNTGSIVLSHTVWETAFAGNKGIIGSKIRINDTPYTVVGVMPTGFQFPYDNYPAGQVWVVQQLSDSDKKLGYDESFYSVIGRLRSGVTLKAAQAEMATIQEQVIQRYTDPQWRADRIDVSVQRYGNTLVNADIRKALLALLAAAGVLWLIASVNVTNLLLARSTARQREIAMRGALGASRGRVLQQMMVEGLVLSGCASVLGIALALVAVRVTGSVASTRLNVDFSTHLNGTILGALCGLTLVSALLSCTWPAWLAVRAPIEPALKQGGQQTGAGRRHNRMRSGLVAVEVAMSLTLLVACGLLLRTIYTLRHVPLGYRTDHIVVANLSIPTYRYTDKNVATTLYQPLLERVQHLHGVQMAGMMSEVPLGQTFNIMLTLSMNGRMVAAGLKPVTPQIQRIFGFPMIAGRFFDDQDTPTSEPVLVVNPAFSREYAPDKHDPQSILGTEVWSLKKGAPKARVIGVMDDQRQRTIDSPSQPEVEVCLCQLTTSTNLYQPSTIAMDLAVRTRMPTSEMIPEIRAALKQASPELANSTFSTMDQIVEDSYGSQRLAAHLLEIFGGSALLLCVAGLYGLLAYVVSQRTRELGVRIALGAQRSDLSRLVLRQAGTMLLIGVAVGTGLAWASARLLRGFLYGVQAHDGWTMASAALLLFLCGMLAAYVPARRAARVNPMEALRSE
ncbi:MAG TPA: ABC transporter permease [Acidobacteriaceae bacterium]|jgi:predicted permease|nr:ABC transporter permease [Acidobacteriaceae bacterium]